MKQRLQNRKPSSSSSRLAVIIALTILAGMLAALTDSIQSDWVEDEVETALEKEQRQQHEILFPVRIDEAVMQTNQAWAAKLRRQHSIGDFTHWTEPEMYQQVFDQLLRDLKKNE